MLDVLLGQSEGCADLRVIGFNINQVFLLSCSPLPLFSLPFTFTHNARMKAGVVTAKKTGKLKVTEKRIAPQQIMTYGSERSKLNEDQISRAKQIMLDMEFHKSIK